MISLAKRKINSVLLSPFLLALIPCLAIFLLVPHSNRKYILELRALTKIQDETYVWYDDIDNDGISEKIAAFDRPNSSGVTISKGLKTLDQWNIRGSFAFAEKKTLFIAADCNNDGIKELFLFSISNDSLFLHCIDDFGSPAFRFRDRFITRIGHGINAPDPEIIPAEAQDLDGDGSKELIFGLSTGFSKHPRKVFAYFIGRDSLISSPESSAFIHGIVQADINRDGKEEILPYGYAAGNIGPEEAKYHDHSGWLTALGNDLGFMFEPVEFKGKYCQVKPLLLVNAKDTITDLLYCCHEKDSTAVLYSFDSRGRVYGRFKTAFVAESGFFTYDKNHRPVYVLVSGEKGVYLLDRNKKIIRHIEFTGTVFITQADIDADGSDEIFVLAADQGRAIVYREGFRDPAECRVKVANNGKNTFSVVHTGGEQPAFSLQAGNDQYMFAYHYDPYYVLKSGIYLLVYAGFLLFVFFVQALQKRNILRKIETEKKISGLQLALVRNQLDPHFAFNAINSVIYSIQGSQKDKAVEQLTIFAHLYRDLVLSAGNSRRTLGEEISFTGEYLKLEKLRFEDRLEYSISVSPGVDLELMVPKLLVQSYAENAVKHGISHLEGLGRISISVSAFDRQVIVTVEDNGVGREGSASRNSDSTGRGMNLMNELFTVYGRHYGDRISSETEDLHDSDGKPAGTKITVRLDPGKERN